MTYIPPHYTDKLAEVDISNVRGNASDETKRFVWAIFKYFLGSSQWFSNSIGQSIQCVRVDIQNSESEAAKAETVFEVDVTPNMCNLFGILHGGCAAYLIDHCSVSSTVALGSHLGHDGTGVSQSMNIIWSEAAPLGARLRIVNTSMVIRSRIRTCRTEIWNGNKLCVSGVHSLVNAPKKMVHSATTIPLPPTCPPLRSRTQGLLAAKL